MNVPFIRLDRTTARIRQGVLESWTQALDSTEFVGGKSVARLEQELATRLSARHVITCANGTDALLVGLQALGVGPGKTVALPNLTFWATYEAVAQLGATPVLVDIDPADLQLSFEQFQAAHRETGFEFAVLVHLYGWATPRLKEFREFCRKQNISLLEDGAQSFGVEVAGESVYSGAAVSTLSFYPAKVLGGCMDGGAILTRDEALAAKIRSLCNHGRSAHYSYDHVGWNSRMGGLQARYLAELLPHAEAMLNSRREAESYYRKRFQGDSRLKVYGPPEGVRGNGYLSVIEVLSRPLAEITQALKAENVGFGRVYPETMDQQPPAAQAPRASDLSVSRRLCRSVISLPVFDGITAEETRFAADAFEKALG